MKQIEATIRLANFLETILLVPEEDSRHQANMIIEYLEANDIIYVKKNDDKMRSWALVFVPIFSPFLGRLSQIIALKYVNDNNKLSDMMSNHGLNSEIYNDIVKIVEYINKKVKEFNKI